MSAPKPAIRPADPRFSCGPTKKRPGWQLSALTHAPLGRTHRGGAPKQRLQEAIDRTAALLEIPEDYTVAILPGSDTGAMEGALWSMIGARGVDVFASDAFGMRWLLDLRDELKPETLSVYQAGFGDAPEFAKAKGENDIVFTWNATSAGVKVPNADFIPDDRQGLSFCDATSAAFAMDLPWHKLDITTLSWQKCMGGEAQHGMAIFSPRARQRLSEYRPSWPVPRVLQLFECADANAAIFQGSTINTPSLMCTEDYVDALKWGAKIGGLSALIARTEANFAALTDWVERTDWIDFLAEDAAVRSNTSVTMKFAGSHMADKSEDERWAVVKKMSALLDREEAAHDINAYRAAPAGLRVWCGPTVDADDIIALGPWLDWAYHEALSA